MKKNALGRTGLEVTEICLGTMTWGAQNTQNDGFAQMDYALESGINFFDTAEMYAVPPKPETQGKTEEIIGNWFTERKCRDKVILASKIAGIGPTWIRNGRGIDRASLLEAIEGNLKRLKTDYIDLYQLHWPNRPNPHFGKHWAGSLDHTKEDSSAVNDNLLEILQTLDDIVKSGKVRHVGLSDDSAWGIMKYLELAEKHDLPRMASIQNEYSLLLRADEPHIAETCVREDVAYLPWSPLAQGMLSGKYLDGARPEGARWSTDDRVPHRDTPTSQDAVRAYMGVAEKHGLDVCQMALAWVRQQPFVTSTIIGATTMDQLKMNIASADITLSDAVMADINAVYRQYPVPF